MNQSKHTIDLECKVSGHFRLEKYKTDQDGKEIKGSRSVAAEFGNLIVNGGLDLLATSSSFMNACQVGTGNTPVSATQTSLAARLAGTSTTASGSTTAASSAPYYVSRKITYKFAEGAAAGNLAEVGIGTTANTSWTMFSRALIKDGSGSPTTITVLSDEALDVIYELRYYAPAEDVTGTITATGTIAGTYDYIIRNSRVNQSSSADAWYIPQAQNSVGQARAFSGDIGLETSEPSGTYSNLNSPSTLAYTAGNYYIDRVIKVLASQGNFTGEAVRSLWAKAGIGCYQIQFDPAIPKTTDDAIDFTLRIIWANKE